MNTNPKSEEDQIAEARINYSAIYRVSGEVFREKAREIFNVPIERVYVGRVIQGNDFGTLNVILFSEKDEYRQYYHFENNSIHYNQLPPNIYEFEKTLKQQIAEGKGYLRAPQERINFRPKVAPEPTEVVNPKTSKELIKEIIDFRKANSNHSSTTHTLSHEELLSVITIMKNTFDSVEINFKKNDKEVSVTIRNIF
jgi:hypothetical protein